jgi:hypothetical protein
MGLLYRDHPQTRDRINKLEDWLKSPQQQEKPALRERTSPFAVFEEPEDAEPEPMAALPPPATVFASALEWTAGKLPKKQISGGWSVIEVSKEKLRAALKWCEELFKRRSGKKEPSPAPENLKSTQEQQKKIDKDHNWQEKMSRGEHEAKPRTYHVGGDPENRKEVRVRGNYDKKITDKGENVVDKQVSDMNIERWKSGVRRRD